jgi:uncharacterized repeat protein (TIGR03803 family)
MKLRNALLLVGLLPGLFVLGPSTPNTRAQTVTNLHTFMSSTYGHQPYAGLAEGADGNFYGTTLYGGTGYSCGNGCGVVFRISPSGTFTNLYSLSGTNGAYPLSAVVLGSDGNLYGTTYAGGTCTSCASVLFGLQAPGCGSVFRISPGGSLTTVYSFTGGSDGANPYAGLVQGSDGNSYGTTSAGGTNGAGTVFRVSSGGDFTNLYSFTGGSDGAKPIGGLSQGSDGNFYGTTSGGGTNGYGTVFQITPSGALTTLHMFNRNDGANPTASLVQGNDGNLYGTTFGGPLCFDGLGTVFRISPNGDFVSLHVFTGFGDGYAPWAGLMLGSDGDFYGTTTTVVGGCAGYGFGTLFRISPSGDFTNLYSFHGGDGNEPMAGLVQGIDGNFYGTTDWGGAYGNVFRLSVPLNPPANQIAGLELLSVFGESYAAVLIPSVAKETYQLQYSDSMNPTNWINSGDPLISIGGPATFFDFAGSTTTQRFYRFAITP